LNRYYLEKILTQAGITATTTQTQVQVIINCWSFAVAIVGSFMLDILGRRLQTFIGVGGMVGTLMLIGGLIKRKSRVNVLSHINEIEHCEVQALYTYAKASTGFGESKNTSGIYATIAVIFFFQGFYAFSIIPMTSIYPTEVSSFKLRATGIAIFRMFDSSFGYVVSLQNFKWLFSHLALHIQSS
jgi:hypothetical protein